MIQNPGHITPDERQAMKVPAFLDAAGITVGHIKRSYKTFDRPTVTVAHRKHEDGDGDWQEWCLLAGGKKLGGFKTSWAAYYAVAAHLEDFHIEYEGHPSWMDHVVPDMSHDVPDDDDED